MKLETVVGGVLFAAVGGLAVGTLWLTEEPTPNPVTLGLVAGGAGILAGALLYSSHRDLARGLIGGGLATGLLGSSRLVI